MISFLICLALLIGGYFLYGKVVENTFGPDDRETPAVKINDGVDYVVLPQWKLFMIQLLNIAGLGPIFGALQGALWGPIVFLWITFGTIFAGGVHDYFSGMMSERNNGASISEISGIYLGGFMKNVMRVFSVVLLIMVGTVFAVGPAGLIVTLFKNGGSNGIVTTTLFWLIIVLVYYFIATFLSIDKIIGKIYPVFGICLIVMAAGVIIGIGGVAGAMFVGMARERSGYLRKAILQQDLSAVTAACMMVDRKAWEGAGGFNEDLAVAFNDIDFCLKVRREGYLVVYEPNVELYHYESKSRGYEDTPEKQKRFLSEINYMKAHWSEILTKGDPYYNENFSLNTCNYTLRKR